MKSTKQLVVLSFPCEWPLVAESGPSKSTDFAYLNDRFREKQTFGEQLQNWPKIR